MKEVIISCSGARHIAKSIAKKAKKSYFKLQVKKFPDGELDIRFPKDIKGKNITLVQSFYEDKNLSLNERIIETLFAAYTAKDIGAKKIKLIALYFPYFRKDKRFNSGECVSIEVMSKLFGVFDKIYVIEPHLHRIKNIKKILPNGEKLSILPILAKYIQKLKGKNKIFIGPDSESEQWAKKITNFLKEDAVILKKTRYHSRKVKVKFNEKVNLRGKTVIILDDIISTGHTMLESVKKIKTLKPKKIYCIAIHGLFAEDALNKLKKECIVLSTNTIPSKASKIDISDVAHIIK